jgi:BirA family biotin operon repressor/biotin-[acetyl-CoA-carboxylase] ligase
MMQTDVSPTGNATRDAVLDAGLDAPLDARVLREHVVRDGDDEWRVTVVATTSSTSSDLLRSVRSDGYTGPTILAARAQTGGRGRLGRRWASEADASLTVSFALRIERPLSALDGVTLVCGLAARDAIARHGVSARLKWPNDLLVDARKLAGILVEPHQMGEATVLVIGVGINLASGRSMHGADGRGLPPIDMLASGGRDLDRNRLAAGLAVALRARLAAFAVAGFAPFIDAWNGADAFRDQPVVLHPGHGSVIDGIARGVDRSGALLLEVEGVVRRIVSGDVSLRPKIS